MTYNNMREIPYEDFVRIWEMSESVTEAATRLGVTRSSAKGRARGLRAKGVKLKQYNTNPGAITPERVKVLNDLVEQLKEEA